MVVTILGAGMMGTAIAFPIVDRGHVVRLVGTHLDDDAVASMQRTRRHPRLGVDVPAALGVEPVGGAPRAIEAADAIVLGVSSAGIDWAAELLSRHLSRPTPIAMVTKGLEPDGGRLRILPDVLADRLPAAVRSAPVTVGGPCIAGELARRRPSAVVLAGRETASARSFADAFRGPYYRVTTSEDVIGVSVCAALKNAYAAAVGVGAGLHERDGGAPGPVATHNLEAALFGLAVSEMRTMVLALGGHPETVADLAGAGDLFVTCQGGRSTRLGRLLGLGRTLAQAREELAGPDGKVTLESVDVTQAVVAALRVGSAKAGSAKAGSAKAGSAEAGGVAPGELPLLHRLHAVLFEGADPGGILDLP